MFDGTRLRFTNYNGRCRQNLAFIQKYSIYFVLIGCFYDIFYNDAIVLQCNMCNDNLGLDIYRAICMDIVKLILLKANVTKYDFEIPLSSPKTIPFKMIIIMSTLKLIVRITSQACALCKKN